MPLLSELKQVKQLLADGQTEDAADLLLELTKDADQEYHTSALLVKNQLERHQQNSIDGILSESEQRIGWAKISRNIVDLTRQIERGEKPQKEEDLLPPTSKKEPVIKFSKQVLWALPVVLFLGFLGVYFLTGDKSSDRVKTEAVEIKMKTLEGQLVYPGGIPVVNVQVEIVPLSGSLPEKIREPIKFTTGKNGEFKFTYPELFENNTQVNISYAKDNEPIHHTTNVKFMAINFNKITIRK